MLTRATACVALLVSAAWCLAAADNPMAPWLPLWSRDASAGRAVVDNEAAAGQPPVIRVEHTGTQDWSLTRKERLAVEAGDIFKLKCRANVRIYRVPRPRTGRGSRPGTRRPTVPHSRK